MGNKIEKEILDNVKRNITLLRKANKLSMRSIASVIGVKENTYRVWEDVTKSGPKPQFIYLLAKTYNVTTDFIYSNNTPSSEKATGFSISDSESDDIKNVYGDKYLSELSNSEKVIIMQLRLLNSEDRNKVLDRITETLNEIYGD